jgi:osmotically-inducible protein OsmY
MSSHLRGIYGLASGFVLAVALTGCATYDKCGFGGCPGDAKTTENVQALLEKHPDLGPPNLINVRTLDQVVYLNGTTATGLESREAESVALEAPSVTRIVNLISVTH